MSGVIFHGATREMCVRGRGGQETKVDAIEI